MSWCRAPSGPHDNTLANCLTVIVLSYSGALSDERSCLSFVSHSLKYSFCLQHLDTARTENISSVAVHFFISCLLMCLRNNYSATDWQRPLFAEPWRRNSCCIIVHFAVVATQRDELAYYVVPFSVHCLLTCHRLLVLASCLETEECAVRLQSAVDIMRPRIIRLTFFSPMLRQSALSKQLNTVIILVCNLINN
jgi:hypothetical protein